MRPTYSRILRNIIRINKPEKNSNPRIRKVSRKLIAMLDSLPHNGSRVFDTLLKHMRKNFYNQRVSIAKKLQNPRIQQTSWCSIRHWVGTMEYHKTKDIIHVKEVLGHKSIQNTMIYINLEQTTFQEQNDEFTTRVAKSLKGARALLEAGFEYVMEMDGVKVFRKRK